jgi:hypothetical protein
MEVIGQPHAPVALHQGKDSTGGRVGLRIGLDAVAKRKNSRPCQQSNP